MRLFAEKYFEYKEDTLIRIDNVRNISQQISSSQDLNIQGDRAFQGLSDCITTFLKKLTTAEIQIFKTHEEGTKNGVRGYLRVKVSSLYSKCFSANKCKSRLKGTG